MVAQLALDERWQLYRLLSDPVRLRLLALAAEEELAIGELAELLCEPQPNVSRHATPLRQAGLLIDRRQGTRTLIRLADDAIRDPVVADALKAGQRLCEEDGSAARVPDVVLARDTRTREFFAHAVKSDDPPGVAPELPAYLCAFAALVERRELAVDAGTGDGALLDALAPLFQRVVALDRSEAQLARALRRVRTRGYDNVELVCGEVDGDDVKNAVGAGADVVVASRMLHHAPLPRVTLKALVQLVRPAGRLIVLDYLRHEDERLREQQADVWMGFEPSELEAFARSAGLCDVRVARVPTGYVKGGFDAHLTWQTLVATRPADDGRPHLRQSGSPADGKIRKREGRQKA